MNEINYEKNYRTERFEASCPINEYLENFIDPPCFEEYCKECKEYNRNWTCPPNCENPIEFWKSFDRIDIYAIKLNYSKDMRNRTYSSDELDRIIESTLHLEREKLKKELLELEKAKDGEYIHSGTCKICKKCSRELNRPCNFPDKRKYTLDALGANILKTTKEFFGFELKWIKNYRLPEYLTLVCAIVY